MPPQQIARHIPRLGVVAPSTAQLLPFNAIIPFNLPDHRLRLNSDNLFDPALFTAPFSWSPKMPLCHLPHKLLRPDHHLPSHLFPRRLDATLHPLFDFTLGTHPISRKGTTETGGAKRRSELGLCLH